MKAKMKVTFERNHISTSEVDRKLAFIEDLPIRAMSHNFQEINDLEMRVFFGKDKVVNVHPENADKIYYTNLDEINGCNIGANSDCINVTRLNSEKGDETYSFFYEKSK